MTRQFGSSSSRDFQRNHDSEAYALDPDAEASRRPADPHHGGDPRPSGARARGRLLLVSLAVVTALGLVVYALVEALAWAPAAARNGDMLGQDSGESYVQYQQRAAESLAQAPAEEDVYALITFARPLDADEAGAETGHLERVNAMIVGLAAPYPLPEPTGQATRADVYADQFEMIARELSGIGDVPVPYQLTAVIAHDDGESLRRTAQRGSVAAVETLPADAAWGWFGVSPVEVPGIDQMDVAVPSAA